MKMHTYMHTVKVVVMFAFVFIAILDPQSSITLCFKKRSKEKANLLAKNIENRY